MNQTIYDDVDQLRVIDVPFKDYRTQKEAFAMAHKLLEYHHYYFYDKERIWKLRIKSSDGNQHVWYGRVLRDTDKACAVFGFHTKANARNFKLNK